MNFPQIMQETNKILYEEYAALCETELHKRMRYVQLLRSQGYTPEEINAKMYEAFGPRLPEPHDLMVHANELIREDARYAFISK